MRVSLILVFLFCSLFSDEEIAKTDSPASVAELPIAKTESAEIAKLSLPFSSPSQPKEEGYTINYQTVSIIEYLRFASKICKINFIYEEADLNFTITVVSDEPITSQNVMATLIQVLRIHGLELLEQDNNLVIHKEPNVKQIATLVTDVAKQGNAPIVTRIFRVKNARPEAIAAVIKPMLSSSAILESSPETRQIILTDVTANVDKVAALIENLDSPHTLLEIKSYEAKFNSPEFLIEVGNQIMNPIAQGNPFILVPQPLANSIFVVSTPELADRAISVFTTLDVPAKRDLSNTGRKLKGENIFVYKVANRPGDEVIKGLMDIAANLQQAGNPEPELITTIDTAKWIRETNSIMLVGSKDSIDKIKEFLNALDTGGSSSGFDGTVSFFVYKPIYRSADEVEKAMLEIASNLKSSKASEVSLIETIDSVKINPSTNTLIFSGEEKNFPRVRDMLATIDNAAEKSKTPSRNSFYIYKIQQTDPTLLQESFKNFAKTLDKTNASDVGLVQTIMGMKYIKENNSLLFTGPTSDLKQVETLVPTFDTMGQIPASSQFFIYKPAHQSGEQLVTSVKDISSNLRNDHLSDPAFLHALESAKWSKTTNSLMFTGDANSLKKVETLIASLDVAKPGYFIYKVQNTTGDVIESELEAFSKGLKSSGVKDSKLYDAIAKIRFVRESNSLVLSGDPAALEELKTLITQYDRPPSKPNYYVYKVQNTTGDVIEEDLEAFAKNLKASGVPDAKILNTIAKIRYVKETNSVLLSGDPASIEEVKTLIAQYDYPHEKSAISATNFYLYKPVHLPAAKIESSLKDIGANLKKAGLADPNLLAAIDTEKYISATNALIFTGNPDALQKIQTLIKDIDVPPTTHAPIQHVGKTTFLLYKLKNANGPHVVTSIKSLTADLKKTSGDKDLVATLSTMKYVKETNSLLFTGTEDSLTKVQALIEKFDVTGLGGAGGSSATNFFVYKPQSLPGPDLEKIISDFGDNLKSSGLTDPDLFNAISSTRWNEKTQTLVFTGSPKALEQVKELLSQFDIPSNLAGGAKGPLEPSIQAIDNVSFLVYKLQFHKGDEIQGALRQIAKDLILTNAPVNKNLLNSINSIQWLEVTNSLLSSGDQETLTRLRELIKSLDIPLKQVFIEVLVIETDLTNALSFGLEWGANYKYRDKFSGTMSNTAPNTGSAASSSGFAPDTTMTNLGNLVPPTAPTPQMLPASGSGAFDLGVIGEVIRHRGQTFLTLASLLQALQTDTETSVIDTPKILTQDGRTSTIFVGRNIPFVGSFVSNSQSSSNTIQSTNIEYRDIGLNLTITPVLGNSDIVTLDINLDRSQTLTDVTQSSLTPGQTANGIITSKTTMQTTVHVPDDNFLILSGAVLNSSAKVKSGFPCLGGLPLVGALFSQSNDLISNTNIVIFLRPHIINSLDDLRNLSHTQEEFFRDQAGTPFLERSFDNGMEMIKTADDE
ncbi:MAG TPA: secretin N-terminal domain-containing protein [Chlamydiales bacterium]|nr:secretin N-terminal domain-containing protein [Chlamydiales bacterium]